jgi:hypothetical protein
LRSKKQTNPIFADKKDNFIATKVYICTTKLMEMLKLLVLTLLIVAICVLFLGVKVFFVKGGKFPNEHISHSKAMQERHIQCITEQDAQERSKSPLRVEESDRTSEKK